MHHFASWANVVQTFWPVIRQPPFSLTALVFSDARSEPDSGSEKPWHQISSAERIGSRKRSFCSSVPWAMTTGPPITSPRTLRGPRRPGARQLLAEDRLLDEGRAAAAVLLRPRDAGPAGRRAACAATRARTRTGPGRRPAGAGPGWLSSSQARNSSRKLLLARLSASDPRPRTLSPPSRRRRASAARSRPGDAGEDHARVLGEDRRRRAGVGAVVDQVEVAEEPVEDDGAVASIFVPISGLLTA